MDVVAGRDREGLLARIRDLDRVLLATVVSLAGVGFLAIYSATRRSLEVLGYDPATYLSRQLIFAVAGLFLLLLVANLDYRFLKVYAPILYGVSVALLVLVQTPFGTTVKGSQRWFQLFGYQFTPSELMKLALIVMLAAYLAERKGREPSLREVLRTVAIASLPGALVFLQPDLGTSIVLAAILSLIHI